MNMQKPATSNAPLLIVDAQYAGQRLDNYLIRELKRVPKALIYRLLRQKNIKLNRKRATPDQRLQAGDEIWLPMSLRSNKPATSTLKPKWEQYFRQFDIIAETSGYVVLNKPAGLACHGGSGISASVIDIMRTQYPEMQLAHRLDKETSGCLILPKNRQALLKINTAIREQETDKYYLCIVHGVWPKQKQKITMPLRKIDYATGEHRVIVDEEAGKPACTLVRRLACSKAYSLLAIKLVTGRTHQIRVHCAASGHAIVGDEKYARDNEAKRLYLHAVQLGLPAQSVYYTAKPDAVFQAFCQDQQLRMELNAAHYF